MAVFHATYYYPIRYVRILPLGRQGLERLVRDMYWGLFPERIVFRWQTDGGSTAAPMD